MVPMEASTLYFFRNERDPRMHKIALRRREKLNFVLMYVIISEYESSVFSLSLVAILFITFAADGPAPPEHEKTRGANVAFSTSIIRFSYFCFLMVS